MGFTTPKSSRSRFGCRTCRARKVKCDERPGQCGNCARLRLVCSGYTVSQSSRPQIEGSTENPPRDSKRKRTYRSCIGCRTSKTKCSGEHPTCQRCQVKGTNCVYSESCQPNWISRVEAGSSKDTGNGESSPTGMSSNGPPTPNISNSSIIMHEPRFASQSPLTPLKSPASSLEWLESYKLPSNWHIGLLVEEYFNNIHPLRCFAFIHRPSFLQRLDKEAARASPNYALLYIICALGAQYYALAYGESVAGLAPKFVLHAGSQWAKQAQRLILETLEIVTIDNLMAAVLLHDYDIRMGNFSNAFMLSGLITRMTQALQINLEYNTDVLCQHHDAGLTATEKESRRRLMWSCYVMDALVGSGVDQLTLVDEKDMKIQLPCNERNFVQQIPCMTETLGAGNRLRFIGEDVDTRTMLPNMGIMAYFVRHISIRKKVLRYIKHLGDAMVPWHPDSEFASLDAECRAWYESLPPSLQFTPNAMYIRKDSSQLGALCLLHCAHYQTICDLYRLGAPALYKLRAAFDFPPDQQTFLQGLQQVLFDAARSLAAIIGETSLHGCRMLADSWLPTITYDSCRIMVYHMTQILDTRDENTKILMIDTLPLIRSNIQSLRLMGSLNAIATSLCSAAETMLERSGIGSEVVSQNIIPDDPYQPNGETQETTESLPGTPPQSAPDYVLNPLSIFRMARKSVPERHAPERAATLSAPNSAQSNSIGDIDDNVPKIPQQDAENITSNEQENLEELQNLFMSDLGWTWQPAETAVGSGIDGAGLLPWAGGYPGTQTEVWPPVFPFPQQI